MAHLESRNGWYRIIFHLKGEKLSKSLHTKSERAASACLAKLKDCIYRFELGLIDVPDGSDPFEFFLNRDGKSHTRESVKSRIKSVSIRRAWEVFKDKLPFDALEESTLSGMQTHVEHLVRLIGQTTLSRIDKPVLQKYIDDRSKETGRYDRKVSVQTIKKELRTFSTIWNWMIEEKLVSHPFPSKKLRYPKFQEKPPFQTWTQIESRIQRGNLDAYQIKELWDCLFLDVKQVEEALRYAKTHARQPVIYPMLCFVAYTGARRGEALRSEIDDLDFDSSVITIREKKRIRGQLSTRSVPMQSKLRSVLQEWVAIHPGSKFTFADVKKGDSNATSISNDQASNFFEKTFIRSKWDVLHGWHLFRHSFCSNCAAAGIEQRIINDWVGHQTNEMVRRYRHLFPTRQQEAIQLVFGE